MAIPKIVHYCWFGEKEKPDSVKKCIESWKKFLPDYQLMEWNEDNFNIEKLQYTKEQRHAFSQQAQIKIMYTKNTQVCVILNTNSKKTRYKP